MALGDFDIALKLDDGRPLRGPHAIGNVLWRSPEGQTGKGVAKASDVYSLALVVRGLCCGKESRTNAVCQYLYVLGGEFFLIPIDLAELAQTNDGLRLEILFRHISAFGPLPTELLDHINDEEKSRILRVASEISDSDLMLEHWPEDTCAYLDSTAKDLISRMSKLNPAARVTMPEVLELEWWSSDA